MRPWAHHATCVAVLSLSGNWPSDISQHPRFRPTLRYPLASVFRSPLVGPKQQSRQALVSISGFHSAPAPTPFPRSLGAFSMLYCTNLHCVTTPSQSACSCRQATPLRSTESKRVGFLLVPSPLLAPDCKEGCFAKFDTTHLRANRDQWVAESHSISVLRLPSFLLCITYLPPSTLASFSSPEIQSPSTSRLHSLRHPSSAPPRSASIGWFMAPTGMVSHWSRKDSHQPSATSYLTVATSAHCTL